MGNIYWFEDLSGSINQHSSPALIGDNEFEILVNVSQSQDGSLSNRLGSQKFLNTADASNPVRGLHMFQKSDGTYYLHMVANGVLYVNGASTWTSQQTGVFTSSSNVDFANFDGLHYMIGSGSGEKLLYATESGNTAQYSGAIEGKYLAENGAYMMVAGGTTLPLRTYFVRSTAISSNIAFNSTTDYFITATPPTGVASFGNGRPFVIFTQDDLTVANPATNDTILIEGVGCASHRSIQTIKGTMIWLAKDGFHMLTANSAAPVEISLPITNDVSADAVINQINGTNWGVTCSGVLKNKYYCILQTLSTAVKGVTLNYCMVEFDTAQQTWKVHTMDTPTLGNVMAQFIPSTGNRNLYVGSSIDGTVYQIQVPGTSTDQTNGGVSTAFTSTINTKHYEFSDGKYGPVGQKTIDRIHLRYTSTSAITIKYSLDGASSYTTLNTLPAASTNRWYWDFLPLGLKAKTIGLQITCAGAFTIFAFGFEISDGKSTGLKGR